jgi:hypothetical protein
MAMKYAAVASDGSKSRSDNREDVDRWAAKKCKAGCAVDIYTKTIHDATGHVRSSGPELVGMWRPE